MLIPVRVLLQNLAPVQSAQPYTGPTALSWHSLSPEWEGLRLIITTWKSPNGAPSRSVASAALTLSVSLQQWPNLGLFHVPPHTLHLTRGLSTSLYQHWCTNTTRNTHTTCIKKYSPCCSWVVTDHILKYLFILSHKIKIKVCWWCLLIFGCRYVCVYVYIYIHKQFIVKDFSDFPQLAVRCGQRLDTVCQSIKCNPGDGWRLRRWHTTNPDRAYLQISKRFSTTITVCRITSVTMTIICLYWAAIFSRLST